MIKQKYLNFDGVMPQIQGVRELGTGVQRDVGAERSQVIHRTGCVALAEEAGARRRLSAS